MYGILKIAMEYLYCLQVHPYVRDNDACRPLVIETLKFLYDLDMDETKELDLSHPLARPRIPHDILFVIGGWSGGSPTNVIETYDTRADRWVLCESTDKGATNTVYSLKYVSHA